jgi:aspartate-semialdehyde dehydrogenase
MKIAIVGATGLVGNMMLQVIDERGLHYDELILVASEKSHGKIIKYKDKEYIIHSHNEAIAKRPTIALFSAGGTTSLEWAPKYAEVGCVVIDNSSAWRMHPDHKLIVPEINADVLTAQDKIIANPNCSTIQMVMVLNPLHQKYKIKRLVISTYQSVSGTGIKAINQLMNERAQINGDRAYHYPIDLNAIPQIDIFLENGYTKEEEKMKNETRKIMRDDSIAITATAVRIPVKGGHSESVNIEFEKEFDIADIKYLLSQTEGVIVQDDIQNNIYPMPLFAAGNDDVFVGRIRRDESQINTINCWIVSDNLRKGAATNAIQIAEYLMKQKLV